ncbi:MAG: divalent metal cation transporter, partial [Gillisia sp.]
LGIVAQKGLSECIREEIRNPAVRLFALILVFSAIVIGNAAYEAGNITGAVLGISAVAPSFNAEFAGFSIDLWPIVFGIIAFSLLAIGNYKILERIFIALVFLMSLAFLITAFMVKPDVLAILKGMFIPQGSSAGILTVMALIGTTVVPYNLFLHASLVQEKWNKTSDLSFARKELTAAIILGGLVSMAIVVSASSPSLSKVNSAADLALAVKPLFGAYATWFIALGLMAAGITSAITAPLAAAYVVKGCLGWKSGLKSRKFKAVWMLILLLGVLFSSLELKPIQIIQFAQVANGLLLPVIAIFLFWMVNRPSLMGKFVNTRRQNVFAIVIIGISIFLGAKSIFTVITR